MPRSPTGGSTRPRDGNVARARSARAYTFHATIPSTRPSRPRARATARRVTSPEGSERGTRHRAAWRAQAFSCSATALGRELGGLFPHQLQRLATARGGRGNLQVVAGVTKSPTCPRPSSPAKLDEGRSRARNYYGERRVTAQRARARGDPRALHRVLRRRRCGAHPALSAPRAGRADARRHGDSARALLLPHLPPFASAPTSCWACCGSRRCPSASSPCLSWSRSRRSRAPSAAPSRPPPTRSALLRHLDGHRGGGGGRQGHHPRRLLNVWATRCVVRLFDCKNVSGGSRPSATTPPSCCVPCGSAPPPRGGGRRQAVPRWRCSADFFRLPQLARARR